MTAEQSWLENSMWNATRAKHFTFVLFSLCYPGFHGKLAKRYNVKSFVPPDISLLPISERPLAVGWTFDLTNFYVIIDCKRAEHGSREVGMNILGARGRLVLISQVVGKMFSWGWRQVSSENQPLITKPPNRFSNYTLVVLTKEPSSTQRCMKGRSACNMLHFLYKTMENSDI